MQSFAFLSPLPGSIAATSDQEALKAKAFSQVPGPLFLCRARKLQFMGKQLQLFQAHLDHIGGGKRIHDGWDGIPWQPQVDIAYPFATQMCMQRSKCHSRYFVPLRQGTKIKEMRLVFSRHGKRLIRINIVVGLIRLNAKDMSTLIVDVHLDLTGCVVRINLHTFGRHVKFMHALQQRILQRILSRTGDKKRILAKGG